MIFRTIGSDALFEVERFVSMLSDERLNVIRLFGLNLLSLLFIYLMNIFPRITASFLLLNLIGCASIGQSTSKLSFSVNEEDARVGFEGKGAAAGMMLMSSMGPMGIAIGVAIDEGIAKKINESFVSQETSIVDACRSGVAGSLAETLADKVGSAHIELSELGYTMAPGGDDQILLNLTWSYQYQDEERRVTSDSIGEDAPAKTYDLEAVKTNGALTVDAIADGCQRLANHISLLTMKK